MSDKASVVVYHSELERKVDHWLWHQGGWVWLFGLALVLLAAGLIRLVFGRDR